MDLRQPIGLLFSIFGLLLIAYGVLHAGAGMLRSGINVDLFWGVVLAAFGMLMLWLAGRARGRSK